MNSQVARYLMRLATVSMGHRRSIWAHAMEAEFEEAANDDRSLSFALGCLVAAWREMPRHEEGRLLLASYAAVILLILPMAALLLLMALSSVSNVGTGQFGWGGLLSGGSAPVGMNEGNVALVPSLTMVVLTLAIENIFLGWLLLDRNWDRAASLVRFGAAATATLVIFTLISALNVTDMILPILCLITQSLVVAAMAGWHAQLGSAGGREAPA